MTHSFPDELIRSLKSAESITILTGAGVSAESGIPTFRGAQTGLWAQYDPEELATPEAFLANPKLVWDWYAWRRGLVAKCEPNAGHYAIATLQTVGPQVTLITQNVDGFHQLAGSKNVIELHGNISRCKCYQLGHLAINWVDGGDSPPTCEQCDSLLRPDVVWFGEGLDQRNIMLAADSAENCDVFFSIGTSSMVYPAAYLPQIALESGALFIEVNPNPTPLTRYANYALQGQSGVVMPMLVDAVWDLQF